MPAKAWRWLELSGVAPVWLNALPRYCALEVQPKSSWALWIFRRIGTTDVVHPVIHGLSGEIFPSSWKDGG